MKKILIFLMMLISIIGMMQGQVTLFEDNLETGAANWTFVNGEATNKWFHGNAAVANATGSLYVSSAAAGTTNPPHTYLGSPQTNSSRVYAYTTLPALPANAINITLSLSAICDGESSYDFFKVFLKPSDFVPTATTNFSGGHGTDDDLQDHLYAVGFTNPYFNAPGGLSASAWTNMTFNIPATLLAGQTKRLILMWRNDGSVEHQPPAGIDNILITYTLGTDEPPPALVVAPLNNATDIFIQQLLQWTPATEGAQPTGYKMYFGTVATPPYISDLGLVTSWTPNPPLAWNSTYYWQVVPYNSFGDAANCPIWTFSTGVDPTIVNFPHLETFDTLTTGQIPYGWERVISQPPNSSWVIEASTAPPLLSPPNHLRIYNGTGSTDAIIIARTPPIQILSGKRIRFFTRASGNGYTLDIGYMTDPTDYTSFVLIENIPLTSTTYSEPEILVTFAGATGDFIAFRHGGGGTGRSIFIDNLTIENIPQGADFYCTTTSLDFGLLEIGTPTNRTVNYQNLGSANLIINHGTLPPDMTVNLPNPITVPPNSSQDVIYTITATTQGSYTGTITMTTNADNAPTYEIAASGYVAATLPPQAYVVGDGTIHIIPQTGSSSSTWRTPAELWYRNSYIQTVYLQNELGFGPGLITSIWYNWNGYNSNENENNRQWRIWMDNTDINEFATADWIDPTSLTEVFNGNVYFFSNAPGWIQIVLDNPFVYTGQNIVIGTYRTPTAGNYPGSSAGFYSTSTPTARSLGWRNDTNPSAWTPETPQTPVRLDGYPNNAFVMEASEPGPVMTLSPNNINFGYVNQDGTDTRTIIIGNVGDATLTASFTLPLPPYITVSNTGTITVAPGANEQINITFSPTTTTPFGDYNEELNITSNSIMLPERTIPLTAQVLPSGLFYIGTGNANTNLPAYTSLWGYTYSQTIYYADQINTPGLITNMYFYWNGGNTGYQCELWDFYLLESDITSYPSGTREDFIPINEFTHIFAGTITLPTAPGWVGFTLDTPFLYTGAGNLVLAANEKSPGYSGENWFHGTNDGTTTNRAIRISRDTPEPFDPELVTTYTNNTPTRISGFANMGLVIIPPEPGPMMVVSPSSLNYGSVNQGSSYSLTFNITNIGDALLSASINPATIPNFITLSATGPFALAPNENETITVTLSPTIATPLDDFSSSLDIISDSILMPERSVPITASILPEGLVVIGTGSTANTFIPISTGWGHSYSQTIYFASEMQGMTPGHLITQIAYYYNGHTSWDLINQWAVYMGHTTETSFVDATAASFFPQSELTCVFTGSIPLTSDPGWVNIELDTPFPYIVGQNLVIGVNNITPSSAYNGSANFLSTPHPASNRAIRAARDNTAPYDLESPLNGNYLLDSNPPNIHLLFTPIATGPYMTISPSTINYGYVNQDTQAQRTITIGNIGDAPLTLSFDLPLPPFITIDETEPVTIDPGETEVITITIAPTAATLLGTYSEILDITSNSTTNPNRQITLSAQILPAGLFYIGTGTTDQNLPAYTSFWGYTYSQTIYYQEQIDTAGLITLMYFYWNGSSTGNLCELWDFYLKETNLTTFPTGTREDFIPIDEFEHVFAGTLTLPNTPGWVGFALDTPFLYSGAGNLVLAANEKSEGYNGSNWFHGTADGSATNRAIRISRDGSIPFDPELVTTYTSNTPTRINGFANIGMVIVPPEDGGYFLMTPPTVNFGSLPEGTTAARTVLFRNIGNEPVEVTISNVPANISLSIDTNIPLTIDADSSVEVTLTITALLPGTYTGTINVTSDALNGPLHVLNLQARFTPEGLIQIGFGNIQEGMSNYMPWDFYYRYSYGQTIYLAEEINMEPGEITGVYFHYNGNNVITENIDIYIAQTTQNSFDSNTSWINMTIDDLYYSGPITTTNEPPSPDNNWVGVLLDQPFVYDPNLNLVIAVNDQDSQMPGSANIWTQTNVSVNRTLSARSDINPYTTLPPTTGYLISRIPNTRLQFEGSTFPRPRNLRGTAGNNIVSLEWDPPNIPNPVIESDFVILNGVKNLQDVSSLNMTSDVSTRNTRNYTNFRVYRNGNEIAQLPATDLTYIDSGVINDNSYLYYVTAVYDEGESNPSNTIVLTPTGPTLHPPANLTATTPNGIDLVFNWEPGEYALHENFESATLNIGWQNIDQDADGNLWEIVANDSKEGNQSIISRSVSQSGSPLSPNNWLISPVTLITQNTYLNYWIGATNNSNYAETYQIKISTTGSNIDDFTETIYTETLSSPSWQRRSYDLTDYENLSVYIAFQHNTQNPQSALKLDGVQIVKPADTTAPGFLGYIIYINELILAEITGNTTTHTVPNAPSGQIYNYYVTTWYGNEDVSYPGNVLYFDGVNVDDKEEIILPITTELKGNYPNPFNPETTISLSLAHESNLKVDIYNIKGQRVITLINEVKKPGEYNIVWKGTDNNGNQIASGIYFYRMQTDDYSAIKRMILLK